MEFFLNWITLLITDIHLKLLDRAVSGARFLTGGVFECDIAHRRSVAVLCMLMVHPLNDALPGPYVPVRVTRGALVAHRCTNAPLRCRSSQYTTPFIPLSVSLWNYLANPVFDGALLAGFKSRANIFYWPKLLYSYYSLLLFLFFLSIGWYCGAGIFGLMGGVHHSLSALHCRPFLIIIIKIVPWKYCNCKLQLLITFSNSIFNYPLQLYFFVIFG